MGATGTVTGSKYLLQTDEKNILIDCGLFQGMKELRLRNWWELPVSAKSIDHAILTHAHIDHSGYIPLLVKNGFRKKILASSATIDLCNFLLPDSGYLQEEDAKRANRYGYTKHHPAQPLYTEKEAEKAMQYFSALKFHTEKRLDSSTIVSLFPASHILGASSVLIRHNNKTILFSGDIGRFNDAILYPPEVPDFVDYIVMESTYGNRLHDKTDTLDTIEKVIIKTINRGGTILIPAFAVGRAQHVLYYLYKLIETSRIPAGIPIYLDSPMAISASDLMIRHHKEHRLTEAECRAMCGVAQYTQSVEQSKAIGQSHYPSIVISASGMATGGRVLHHLKTFAPHKKNTILFTGFQAQGTRGDRILRGEKEVKIHGDMVPINAEVRELTNMSAHADSEELLQWLSMFKKPPVKIFITHGEPDAALAFKTKIKERFGWDAVIPQYLQTEEL